MDHASIGIPTSPPAASAVYFDGTSSRRRVVTLRFADALAIDEEIGPLRAGPMPTSAAPTALPGCCG
jgi:hypothetical protein